MTATPYNFQKPGKLNTTLERQFHGWLQTACALATRHWHKELPAPLALHAAGADSVRARPALLGLPEECVAYRIVLQEHLVTLLTWPRPVALGLIGTLLGDLVSELPADRELTPVDDSLFEFFLRDLLLPSFVESWNGQSAIRPEISGKVANARYAKLYAADESLLAASFTIKGAFGDHDWRWFMPKKGLMANLQDDGVDADLEAAVRGRLEEAVRDLPVDVTVSLGGAELPLAQLAQLQVGDVILLDQRVNQPLTAHVEGVGKMRGWPGRLGSRQAFRLEQWSR